MKRGRYAVRQIDQIRHAADLVQPFQPTQLVGDSGEIGRRAAVVAGQLGLEDPGVLLDVEMFWHQPGRDRHHSLAVEEDRAQRRTFGTFVMG